MESQFNQIVRDVVNDLKHKGTGYCFSLEQLNEIQKMIRPSLLVQLANYTGCN